MSVHTFARMLFCNLMHMDSCGFSQIRVFCTWAPSQPQAVHQGMYHIVSMHMHMHVAGVCDGSLFVASVASVASVA